MGSQPAVRDPHVEKCIFCVRMENEAVDSMTCEFVDEQIPIAESWCTKLISMYNLKCIVPELVKQHNSHRWDISTDYYRVK